MPSRRQFLYWTAVAGLGTCAIPGCSWSRSPPWPMPPQPPRVPKEVGRFGPRRIDDYDWFRPRDWHAVLRDPTSLEAPIRTALDAENAYLDAMMAPARALRDRLAARMEAIDAMERSPLETRSGGYAYFRADPPGAEHPVYLRRREADGVEQVLLDAGREADGATYYALGSGGPQHSADHRLYAWSEDRTGSNIYAIKVREIDSERLLVSDITDAHGGFALSSDGRYLFWVGRDDKGRPVAVHRREIALGGANDEIIYREADPAFFIELRTMASGRYLVIRMLNGEMTEVRLVPMATPTVSPLLVEPRRTGHRYDVEDWNGQLVVTTDRDGAFDYQLMRTPYDQPGEEHWRPLVPHVAGRYIVAVHPFADRLIREEWRDANPHLVLMRPDGSEEDVRFDEPAYMLTVPHGQAWDAPALAFSLESPRLPPLRQSLSLADGALSAEAPARSDAFDPERYEVRRLEVPASDGALIPLTVLMRKGAQIDGSRPLYLDGYGSYGVIFEPRFSSAAITLVEQDWIYAIAHVRGGGERGSQWWQSVLRHGKKTTFSDFIACAEHLIRDGYTSRGRIVAHGLSAGGLLMGAAYTMRPDLWAGVIAQVPFVDVLTTLEEYEIHPLGSTAFPIWGDPRIPEDLAYVASYSPYDHLREAAYPALLATGSVADDRVAFWEPVKFAVKARSLTTAGNPIMVHTSMTTGHQGDPRTSAKREQQALFQAFAIWAADRRWGEVPQRPD